VVTSSRTSRGFTLLEVMVAVAILGLGLTAILSAQTGAFAASAHARNISIATGLARCKMSELEESLLRDGFQELDVNETGPCCDGEDSGNIRCSWQVAKPEMPPPKLGELDLDTGLDTSTPSSIPTSAEDVGSALAAGDGGIGALAGLVAGPAAAGGESAAGGVAGYASMAMDIVYPDIKAMFEQSTRRVTVTVSWTEGSREHSFNVVQWVAFPQKAIEPIDQGEGGGGP
jgi:general secretion pathway protein I